MEITSENLVWTADDESAWATFLSGKTGQRLLPKLVEKAPPLLEAGDTNEILIRNGKLLGFQTAVQALLELTHSEPPAIQQETTAYPSLTQDDAWSDGEKLNP
jgi:hypothetical protein